MKILLVNKFYYRRGGDCIYMLNLEQLLKTHGHDVAVFAMDYPENIETEWKRYFPNEIKFTPGVGMLETFMRMFGLGEVKRKFNSLLNDFKPDVIHLNNIHTQLSPVIACLAHERGIKVFGRCMITNCFVQGMIVSAMEMKFVRSVLLINIKYWNINA